jgi:hypothetical protein
MSRIYQALKHAEQFRSQNSSAPERSLSVMDMPDRRCGERWDLDCDLTIYGYAPNGSSFFERAKAIKGNANGGQILLGVPVYDGQELLLINNRTLQREICRIIHVHIRDMNTSEVSVAFSSPHLQFWEVSFEACKQA